MTALIEILINFGFIRSDYKHRKKISEEEKKEKTKRPFQKYFLQPSILFIISAVIIGSAGFYIFFRYQQNSSFPEKTEKEITEITIRLNDWKEKFGSYPEKLNEIIGQNPMRKTWIKDKWNRSYKYSISNNGENFLIISAGTDGQFDTEDDIKSE